ncbi:MAG TPA: NRDE family protein [Burkholderiales bacterium]|nr:NRDE family protein [Burkholderiales bacterium]
MCLMLFMHRAHARYPLVLAANRDESYSRPSTHAGFWADAPHVLAGRDRDKGGTWLGVTRSGRIAGVTNFRHAHSYRDDAPSRGALVGEYLRGDVPPGPYLRQVEAQAQRYNGFNLIAGDRSGLHYLSNRLGESQEIAPGIHGLSNHLLDTPWPKVEQGKRALERCASLSGAELVDALFDTLASREIAADPGLPDTGVGLERERVLSPAFIAAAGYGTRSSTVLLIDAAGRVTFVEKNFGPMGAALETVRHEFVLDAAPAAGSTRAAI